VLVTCENGDYAADGDIAEAVPRAPEFPARLDAPEEIETPGVTTCEALGTFLGVDVAATSKAMPVTKPDGAVVLVLVRGDDRLSEMKLYDALPGDSRPSTDEEILAAFGAPGGSLGPVGFAGEVVADLTLQAGQFVAGANREGWHLRGVEAGRDYQPRFADLREPKEGDRCPKCGGLLRFQTAVEVGHIFNFGSFYSGALQASFLDEDGQEKPLLGGSYGIGPARVMAAAVEQSNDENGIIWPKAIAPYDVHVVVLKGAEEIGEQAARVLSEAGLDVLLDDRDQRPGEKFADADLIGIPIRITAGKKSLEDGAVDVRDRAGGEERRVSVDRLGKED
jgi:prolyl-tRNA synthetase